MTPHQHIRRHERWGTYGRNAQYPLHYVLIMDLSDSHIEAILRTQSHIYPWYRSMLQEEQIYRIFTGIIVPEREHYQEPLTYRVKHSNMLPLTH